MSRRFDSQEGKRMNRAEALDELARRHPESAELIAIVRQPAKRGAPPKKVLTPEERAAALKALILKMVKAKGVASRSEVYRACANIGTASEMDFAIMDLTISHQITAQTSRAEGGGRPQTLYSEGLTV
jgi:hypothetical protein